MRNKDFTLTVLQHLREGKTEKEIALLTQRHRNTISNHVRWLRQNFAIEPQLLTNQTLQKIQQRLNEMADRDLIHFLSVLLPTRIEASTTHTERLIKIELSAKTESKTLCLNPSESNMNHTTNKPYSIKDATTIVTEQPSQA